MTDKRPSFQWYPKDYLSDENVALMSLEEEGAYRRLMDFCWLQGSIPGDMESLGKLCKNVDQERMAVLWDAISKCFKRRGERYVHPRLEIERRKQDSFKKSKSRAGTAGAEARWQKEENGSAIVLPMAKNGSSSASASSSSSSTPVSKKNRKKNGVGETAEILQANELLGFWIDQQISKPATPQITKQGAAAKRICLAYSREQVVQAAVGISQLFPYSGGEPWDLFDLERKFAKAMEAANNNPDVKIQRDIQHTLEILGGVPNA